MKGKTIVALVIGAALLASVFATSWLTNKESDSIRNLNLTASSSGESHENVPDQPTTAAQMLPDAQRENDEQGESNLDTQADDVEHSESATPLARITKLGTVDWLNGRDLAETRLGNQIVEKIQIVNLDWAAIQEFAFDEADDLDFTLPLFDGNKCEVVRIRFNDLPDNGARQVIGYCKGYAEMMSGVHMETGKFGMVITPLREQFRILVAELNDTQAGVFQIRLSPEEIALSLRIE